MTHCTISLIQTAIKNDECSYDHLARLVGGMCRAHETSELMEIHATLSTGFTNREEASFGLAQWAVQQARLIRNDE